MANTSYKHILLVGAGGNLGKHILSALIADNSFNISVLTRLNSSSAFPSNVKVIKTDYSDNTALVKALNGQEIVISLVGVEAVSNNFDSVLLKAALEAGVKWFIPSEFGVDTSHSAAANNPALASKIAVANLLKENQSRIAHTFIITGMFLDWGFDNGILGFDIVNHTCTLYDEGTHLISGITLPHVGQAVVAILHHPELTKNKHIYVADATFSQQEALSLFEKYTASKWTTKQVSTESLLTQGAESFAKGDITPGVFSYLLNVIYNGQGASNFENKTSNEILGLEKISLENIIKEVVDKKNAAK